MEFEEFKKLTEKGEGISLRIIKIIGEVLKEERISFEEGRYVLSRIALSIINLSFATLDEKEKINVLQKLIKADIDETVGDRLLELTQKKGR